ncbi:MAG: hypothetical protein AB7P11_20785 [Hydrogenophaga sp.]
MMKIIIIIKVAMETRVIEEMAMLVVEPVVGLSSRWLALSSDDVQPR